MFLRCSDSAACHGAGSAPRARVAIRASIQTPCTANPEEGTRKLNNTACKIGPAPRFRLLIGACVSQTIIVTPVALIVSSPYGVPTMTSASGWVLLAQVPNVQVPDQWKDKLPL